VLTDDAAAAAGADTVRHRPWAVLGVAVCLCHMQAAEAIKSMLSSNAVVRGGRQKLYKEITCWQCS
jgi:hypothetical protein